MDRSTGQVLFFGLIGAVALNIPFYAWIFNEHWPWATGLPLGPLGSGLGYMATFFHEIGHTIFAWFYGYPTLPMFDFKHGGGLSVWFSDQQLLLVACVDILLVCGILYHRESRALQILFSAALFFNLATAFNEDVYMSIVDFMGPAFEPLVAGFLLFRALFDLAPRGGLERFLNSLIGFGMIFGSLINCYGLLKSTAFRLVYFEQKGSHGFGDFDKIADRWSGLEFEHVVIFHAGLVALCLITPFFLYFFNSEKLVK